MGTYIEITGNLIVHHPIKAEVIPLFSKSYWELLDATDAIAEGKAA